MTPAYTISTKCQCCGSSNTFSVLKLADTPLEDQFLREPTKQDCYPLDLMFCEECSFAFLKHKVNADLSYLNYVYNTNITSGLPKHYLDYASSIISKLKIQPDALAVDIGSNDGTMLRALQRSGMRVLGVEPAESIANTACENGLPTVAAYFSSDLAARIRQDHGNAAVVTANYMFANIPDFDDFIDGVKQLIEPNGAFIIQTGYHPDQFGIGMFDYIYHEHFSYFTLKSFQALFQRHDLEIFCAQKQAPKGGSIRVFAGPKDARPVVINSISKILCDEKSGDWHNEKGFKTLQQTLTDRKKELLKLLNTLSGEQTRVVGFGASHSTTTLIYEFGLGAFLDYLIDDNPIKHGTLSPGLHLNVHRVNYQDFDQNTVLIVLAWQHCEVILRKHRQILDNGTTIVVPMPTLQTIRK